MSKFDLTNQFLIAMPMLNDPNFHQTVAFMCAHTEEGAMGIVINRPTEIPLGEVLAQLELKAATPEIENQIVFQGGPVQRDRGFVIHRPLDNWDSTIKVSPELGVSTSSDILEAISKGDGPNDALVALGYAGWGAGQLEQEMGENAWLSGPCDESVLFATPVDQRWRRAAELIGIDVNTISPHVGHA